MHCTNQLVVKGDKAHISDLLNFDCRFDGKTGALDFNAIRPIPGALHIPCGQHTEWALAVVSDEPADIEQGMLSVRSVHPDIRSRDDLHGFMASRLPRALDHARLALRNRKVYGYQDARAFALDNWGTPVMPWTDYNIMIGRQCRSATFAFETLDHASLPITTTVAGKYPELTFEHRYVHEDMTAFGHLRCENGAVSERIGRVVDDSGLSANEHRWLSRLINNPALAG